MDRHITAMIQDAAKEHFKNGGRPAEALMTPALSRAFAEEWSSASKAQNFPGPVDGTAITKLTTPYGDIEILTSPYCPPGQIYIGDVGQMRKIAGDTARLYLGED